jgi:Ca-activated chloride channel homolog
MLSKWPNPAGFTFLRSVGVIRVLGAAVLTIAACSFASAQVDLNEVTVLPRTTSVSAVSPGPVLRSNVDLVLVNVTVLDSADQAVGGLQQSDFAVLDDNHRQTVRYASNVDEPASVVVVFDASASMATKIQAARNAVTELVNSSNPQDEFSVVVVNNEPRVFFDFGAPLADIQTAIASIQPDGFTALWDGIYLGVQELRASHNRRKAIIVISDGGDNHSRYTESEVKSLLQEADAEVYAIGIFDRFATRIEERRGPLQLEDLTSVTGGRLFSVHDATELSRAMTQISRELRDQYVLGYYASSQARDGKWHKLKVYLSKQASTGRFRLYAKKGYYAGGQ